LEKSRNDQFVALRNLYLEKERTEREAEVAILAYIQSYRTLLETLVKLDTEHPDPDLLRDLLTLQKVTVDAGLSVVRNLEANYLNRVQILANLEPDLDGLIVQVSKLTPFFEILVSQRIEGLNAGRWYDSYRPSEQTRSVNDGTF
jgi:hypothetical protein